MTISFSDCADDTTPAGKYARVASSTARIASSIGHFAKIGDGAVVGRNSDLGPWCSIGHFARVGDNVEFGSWASVGMCAVVENGSKLGSHQYVPSGHRLDRNGKLSAIGGFSAEDLGIFQLYDSFMGDIQPRGMSMDEANYRDGFKRRQAGYFLERLPAFLERRKVFRQERPSMISRLLSLASF